MSEGRYTELQVCKSGAGWYIGRMYWNPDFGGFWEPGSRESDYYASDQLAQIALDTGMFTRDAPEVELMYQQNPGLERPKTGRSTIDPDELGDCPAGCGARASIYEFAFEGCAKCGTSAEKCVRLMEEQELEDFEGEYYKPENDA